MHFISSLQLLFYILSAAQLNHGPAQRLHGSVVETQGFRGKWRQNPASGIERIGFHSNRQLCTASKAANQPVCRPSPAMGEDAKCDSKIAFGQWILYSKVPDLRAKRNRKFKFVQFLFLRRKKCAATQYSAANCPKARPPGGFISSELKCHPGSRSAPHRPSWRRECGPSRRMRRR